MRFFFGAFDPGLVLTPAEGDRRRELMDQREATSQRNPQEPPTSQRNPQEPPSPAKKRCLNASLTVPKVEKEPTPKRQAVPAEYTSPGQAAPARDSKRHKPSLGTWQQKLRTTPSKLIIALGTPTPPRGHNRQATALHEYRHARPPPPLPSSLRTRGAALSGTTNGGIVWNAARPRSH